MGFNYRGLPPDRKQEMAGVVDRWARTGTAISVLTEGLSILAAPGRVAHFRKLREATDQRQRDLLSIAFTLGRNYSGKGVLSQDDAQRLLDLVKEVREAVPEPPSATSTTMVRVSNAFFKGELPPSDSDASWKATIDVMFNIDPSIFQKTLL
ncbi:MAG: hypothetical protein ABH842_03095 [Candidatus Micrarchaeota archaeon]